MCVINGHVHPRDSVEKIQYASQFGGATLYCQGVSTADAADVLRDPENYPVSITFKRPTVNEVVVEGAGTAEFNGTYKRDGERDGFPCFVKRGRWQGGSERFLLRAGREGYSWSIMIPSSGEKVYASKSIPWYKPPGVGFVTPPETGWIACSGDGPAPTLQF